MQLSLRARLILFVIVPVAFTLAVGSYFALQSYEDQMERRMQEDVELVARALQLPVSRAVERGHSGVLERALESVGQINRVFGLYVYDADGRLTASMGDDAVDRTRRPEDELGGPADAQRRYSEVSGRRVYSYFVPLMDSGNRVIGLLHVTRRAADIDQTIQEARRRVGLILLAVLIFTGFLVLVGHREAAGRHLRRLRESMRRVEEGERDHRAKTIGPSEIAQVAGSLNLMLDSLERAETAVLESRQQQWQLEQRLEHTEKLAAIGQLAAGVAHELGTPLSVIDGKAQRALRDSDLTDHQRDTWNAVRAQVQRTELIVRQLLDFARRNVISLRPTSPSDIVKSAASVSDARARETSTSLDVHVPTDVEPIAIDRPAMERVLTNIVANAIDAAPGGHVRLRYEQQNGNAAFVVEDDGPGIAPADRKRIMEPFFTTKNVGEGTGLGLSVAHGIVEEHGGWIEIGESSSGGASIKVILPVDHAQQ